MKTSLPSDIDIVTLQIEGYLYEVIKSDGKGTIRLLAQTGIPAPRQLNKNGPVRFKVKGGSAWIDRLRLLDASNPRYRIYEAHLAK